MKNADKAGKGIPFYPPAGFPVSRDVRKQKVKITPPVIIFDILSKERLNIGVRREFFGILFGGCWGINYLCAVFF